ADVDGRLQLGPQDGRGHRRRHRRLPRHPAQGCGDRPCGRFFAGWSCLATGAQGSHKPSLGQGSLARRRRAWGTILKGGIRMKRRFRRATLLLLVVGLLAVAVVASSASPALAYGKANWQVAINGTATFPGTGTGFGFGGWCEFAGGVTSGNDGDCEFAQYFHAPAGSGFTCHLSLDVSSWNATGGTF